MIIKAEEHRNKEISEFCKHKILGARILCLMQTYKNDYDFFSLMICENDSGKITALISLFDNNATLLTCEDCEYEEISEYLNFIPFSSLTCEAETAEKLGLTNYEIKTAYKFDCFNCSFNNSENAEEIDYKSIYDIISSNIPDSFSNEKDAYLSWLSDFTFRKHRNMARMRCIKEQNEIISCALTSAECSFSAIISGVASVADKRKKGAGKSVVLSLTNELLKENKDVYVIALNDSAKGFYEHIGFKEDCRIAITER